MQDELPPTPGAFDPIKPKARVLSSLDAENFMTSAGVPHAHLPTGDVVPVRNRAERRAAKHRRPLPGQVRK